MELENWRELMSNRGKCNEERRPSGKDAQIVIDKKRIKTKCLTDSPRKVNHTSSKMIER